MGILALLIADREANRRDGRRTAHAILAAAGLTEDEIAAVSGTSADKVRALIASTDPKPLPAWFSQPAPCRSPGSAHGGRRG
jgi:hypothetical protein